MTILDILNESCDMLGLENEKSILATITTENETTVISNNGNVSNLFNLVKFSLQELCTHYVPVSNEVEIATENLKYHLSGFTNYIRIQNVFKNNEPVNFKILNGNIVVEEDGNYNVKYLTYPEIESVFDDIDFLSKFSPDVIVFGLCSYYCLSHGMFEEFENMHARYIEKAESLKDLKIFNMPQRSWE